MHKLKQYPVGLSILAMMSGEVALIFFYVHVHVHVRVHD
jgi:hypothetical protein